MISKRQNIFKSLVLMFSLALILAFVIPQKNANASELAVNNLEQSTVVLNNNSFKINSKAIKGLTQQEIAQVEQNIELMNTVIRTSENVEVSSNSVTLEITDTELIHTAKEAGYDIPIKSVRGPEGITKIKVNSWGVELWLSKTAIKTLGAVGYAGFAWMVGVLFPGFGSLVAGIIAPIYTNYVINKANALYIKYWYTGKRVVSYQ